ncbi:MAG: hypothetical protein KF862_02165 [Chitinophagaceae bacterium]|nr:hypothetical protein [Chitinophagaceae bacterium]
MNSFALEIRDDKGAKCTFYTVRRDEANSNETDKFFAKYNAVPELKSEVQKLLSFVLDSTGDDHGAIDILLNRFEQEKEIYEKQSCKKNTKRNARGSRKSKNE